MLIPGHSGALGKGLKLLRQTRHLLLSYLQLSRLQRFWRGGRGGGGEGLLRAEVGMILIFRGLEHGETEHENLPQCSSTVYRSDLPSTNCVTFLAPLGLDLIPMRTNYRSSAMKRRGNMRPYVTAPSPPFVGLQDRF